MKFSNLLVGACGALNIINLHSYLMCFMKSAASVKVILTRAASGLVQASSVQAITFDQVYTDESGMGLPVPHISLTCWAEVFIVVPATANILGKAANGIADDLLSTAILASRFTVFFVPSMNEVMWQKPSVQRNVRILEEDGHFIVRCRDAHAGFEASSGKQISTELMPSPEETMKAIEQQWVNAHKFSHP